jgi:hypothetical protein
MLRARIFFFNLKSFFSRRGKIEFDSPLGRPSKSVADGDDENVSNLLLTAEWLQKNLI